MGATAAALLLVTVPLLLRDDSIAQPQVQVLATIEVLTGTARLMSSAEHPTEPALLQVGDSVRAGDGVDTTKGGLAALRLAGGASVRIGRDTRLRLQSYSSMTLEEGTIYIDSGEGGLDRSVEVHTPLGVARDIGTRFEVRLDGSGLRIRVRDGLVRLAQGNASHLLNVGDELTLDQKGTVARRTVPLYGADWSWAAALGRPFDVEGRSLHQFVDWVAGENGWQVRFANPVVEQKSHATTLHGSIQGRTVQEALSALLPAGGVAHRLENGVLRIVDAGADKD